MQLKKPRGASARRSSLAAATLGLLGATSAQAQDTLPTIPVDAVSDTETRKWTFDTGMLVYSESGGRVQAVEPVLQATRLFPDDRQFTTKLVVDTLTGSSPNGATPASTPQTFSSPSGGRSYTTPANELPLDDSFKDTRVALSGDYLMPVGADGKLGFGLNGSQEFDFFSVGGNLRYAHDLNQGNTTLSAGLSYEADTISPVGGTPIPLSQMPAPGDGHAIGADEESKDVVDFVLGVTQVINPLSLVQFNYSLSQSSGYHTDPYKVLSVVGPDGEPRLYVYESRPDSRTKHALFAHYKRFVFAQDVFDLSYRFMTDDWGVQSHTADALFRWNFGERRYLEPHLRWYTQTAADFYHVALDEGQESTVDYASADPRLGAFDGITAGLKYGQTLQSGNAWNARLEFYQQTGKDEGVPPQAAAGLAKFDTEPDLSAVMFTVGYRFKW